MLVGEPHVRLCLHGYEVYVGMWHLKPQYALSYLGAGECLLDGYGYLLGKDLQPCQFLVREVEDVVDLSLWYAQGVTFLQGTNVEECQIVLVLGNLVTGYFSCNYSAEYCHGVLYINYNVLYII